uniref:Uncharacterized protein MANES_09G112000 n=1 Tax=Rhizophora mucronata TaxID=61149 RepID=A0A2P2KNM6_RHIMU
MQYGLYTVLTLNFMFILTAFVIASHLYAFMANSDCTRYRHAFLISVIDCFFVREDCLIINHVLCHTGIQGRCNVWGFFLF